MLRYRDFAPKVIAAPGLFNPGEHETFDDAVVAANEWIAANKIKLINLETVVLPNIWSRWEEGPSDGSLGTSGDSPSRWHQLLRCWYLQEEDDESSSSNESPAH